MFSHQGKPQHRRGRLPCTSSRETERISVHSAAGCLVYRGILSKMLSKCLDKPLVACLHYLMDFWEKCPLKRDRMCLLRNKILWSSISYQNIPRMNEWNWEPVSWISYVLSWLWLKRERRVLFRLNSLGCNYTGLIAFIYIYMAIYVSVFWLFVLSEEITNC